MASRTSSGPWFGPPRPPRRMTWQSGFPLVETMEACPWSSMPKKTWLPAEARQPSIATVTSPSVAFLNPTGIDRPEAS